ncbi:MAG TPA: lantibiotic dehydratase [Candidatus Polarisedimenticolaceae bacterium]|nr:lantibiotic dehydratase [Candidatus Polarisedimenticolaceae bacterium]
MHLSRRPGRHRLTPPGSEGGQETASLRHPLLLLRVTTFPFDTLERLRGSRSADACRSLAEAEDGLAQDAVRLADALFAAAGEPGTVGDAEMARARLAVLRLRRDVHHRRSIKGRDLQTAAARLDPVVRARLERFTRELDLQAGRRSACRETIARELRESRSALLHLARHPLVEEGLWLASRSLACRLHELKSNEPGRFTHDARHVAGKLLAYVVRFCTKTSPNGLFCATALAAFGDAPSRLEGVPTITRTDTILSVAEARKVAACLAADPALDDVVVPRPNPTLRENEEGWTFWKPASMRSEDEEEIRSQVKAHPVMHAFLEEARNGHNVPALVAAVAASTGIAASDLEPFYRLLVERGVLLGELELPYNTRRPLQALAKVATTAERTPAWLPPVREVEHAVDRLGTAHGPERMDIMERTSTLLDSLPHVRSLKPDELFRVDAASGLRVQLPSDMLCELEAGLRPYIRLFSAFYPERIYRSAQATRFLCHFPADTEVNLLDLYHGIFEPEDKRRPVDFPDPTRVAVQGEGADLAAQALARAREHFAQRAREARPDEDIHVTDAEVRALVGGFPEPRWSAGVLFHVAASSTGAIAGGDYQLVLSALFQGTGLALARFAHLHGEAVVQELRDGWSCLERPGTVLAELTYNHSYRTANAGLRPSIFTHEIELPGERGTPGARVIPLAALTIRWDSCERRFVLTWPETGLEVLPVISSGVNPVGFISFLVEVGQQGLQPLGLFPGFSAEGVTHWPRFVAGKVVLFRERWIFPYSAWPAIAADEVDTVLHAALWRHRHGLPRHVFVHTSGEPKPRYVDLDSPAMVALLWRGLANDVPAEVHVTEMLPGPDEMWVQDEKGRYASEFLVHLGSDRLKGTRA